MGGLYIHKLIIGSAGILHHNQLLCLHIALYLPINNKKRLFVFFILDTWLKIRS